VKTKILGKLGMLDKLKVEDQIKFFYSDFKSSLVFEKDGVYSNYLVKIF